MAELNPNADIVHIDDADSESGLKLRVEATPEGLGLETIVPGGGVGQVFAVIPWGAATDLAQWIERKSAGSDAPAGPPDPPRPDEWWHDDATEAGDDDE